jgi:hypothetical protein
MGEADRSSFPYILLLMMMVVISLLRRAAWMKWLPPIAALSPSPVMTMTLRWDREL